MTGATLGSWCSYSTTLIFQIAFAHSFGASNAASAFVLVFAAVISLSGVFASAGQTLVVPRLIVRGGRLSRQALTLWVRLSGAMGLMVLILLALIGPLAAGVAAQTDVTPEVARDLIGLGLLVAIVQFVAIGLASLSLTTGARFAPAAVPALPTLSAAVWLMATRDPEIPAVMVAFAFGSLLQCLALGVLIFRKGFAVVDGPFEGLGSVGALTVLNLGVLALLPPLERLFAASADPAGAAHFDYALRSLLAAQQLIVAGAVLSSLGDWSSQRFAANAAFVASVHARLVVMGAFLVTAALVALLMAPLLVSVVYERGVFNSGDTERVAFLLRVALPSFIAGGIGLLVSQALVAAKRNRELVLLGLTRFALRVVFATIMVRQWGITGLVAGISIADSLTLAMQFAVWRRTLRRTSLPFAAAG